MLTYIHCLIVESNRVVVVELLPDAVYKHIALDNVSDLLGCLRFVDSFVYILNICSTFETQVRGTASMFNCVYKYIKCDNVAEYLDVVIRCVRI